MGCLRSGCDEEQLEVIQVVPSRIVCASQLRICLYSYHTRSAVCPKIIRLQSKKSMLL